MPESGIAYNVRQLEVQCANQHGVLDLDEWYSTPIRTREWKVAAMIVPNILTMLDARRRVNMSKIESMRG